MNSVLTTWPESGEGKGRDGVINPHNYHNLSSFFLFEETWSALDIHADQGGTADKIYEPLYKHRFNDSLSSFLY